MAIKRLKHRKTPGVDNITAEEIEAARQGTGLTLIHTLCKRVWEEEGAYLKAEFINLHS